ncbi:MAG: photosynthetic reaction center cytochrome PufC [Myxococcota bacterium]
MTYIVLGGSLAIGLVVLYAAFFRPDVTTVQRGFKGIGMELNVNRATAKMQAEKNQMPEPLPAVPLEGPRAGDIYQNVQVLGNLSVAQFGRMMNAYSLWVAGNANNCAYCHNVNNMASDEVYTKVVARKMTQMTQNINQNWTSHVGATGVTCYTCHRGNGIPEYVWWSGRPGPNEYTYGLGSNAQQNAPAESVGLASLPGDPFSSFLMGDRNIGVAGSEALPHGNRSSIKQTEWTYGLMMHFSNALGVNCTYCHQSRAFKMWNQSPPPRATAWYGIRMVREVNNKYIGYLQENEIYPADTYPDDELPKANCMTCHQGVYKPLLGAPMLNDYPSLKELPPKDEVSLASP